MNEKLNAIIEDLKLEIEWETERIKELKEEIDMRNKSIREKNKKITTLDAMMEEE